LKPPGEVDWTSPGSPRIWRAARSHATNDEPLRAAEVYTDEELARIAEAGFTGVWLFCQLYDLMESSVFPELNRAKAAERIASIQTVIERGKRHGVGVWLYFNEPVGIPVEHPFWKTHPDLKGVEKWRQYSLCTSTPQVMAFFADAVHSVVGRLPGMAGVILITACESLTHCWSKRNTRKGDPPPECPRCRERAPSDIVLELLQTWVDASERQPQPFRVLAWNWEWAYWYPDPQAKIATRLPEGVELLLDLEIGGTRPWRDRANYIGEYSLSYVGPSQRFVATREAVRARGVPVHAKIQINVTHELCSVPNLPVLHTLHGKFTAMIEQGAAGFMGTWNMGSELTLNAFAMKLFLTDPQRFLDRDTFLSELAARYFDVRETSRVVEAWRRFSEAFAEYPFTVRMLYFGPHNDAPARVLSLQYEGKPIGSSYVQCDLGDDLSKCLESSPHDAEPFTLDEVADAFTHMADQWALGVREYEAVLGEPFGVPTSVGIGGDVEKRPTKVGTPNAAAELRCAQMIGIQLRSVEHVFRFHRRRAEVMRQHGLTAPCQLPADPELVELMRKEIANAERALPLVDADARLGFHQEFQGYKYNGPMIRAKIAAMRAEWNG
jgi:hypothetical protein